MIMAFPRRVATIGPPPANPGVDPSSRAQHQAPRRQRDLAASDLSTAVGDPLALERPGGRFERSAFARIAALRSTTRGAMRSAGGNTWVTVSSGAGRSASQAHLRPRRPTY